MVARAGVLNESGNMAVVTTNGSRTTTRGLEKDRRCGKRAENDGMREKGEMNERRGVEVGSWAGLCVSRAGIWYIGASSSNDNEKAPPMCCLLRLLSSVRCLRASACSACSSFPPLPPFLHSLTTLHLLFPFSRNRQTCSLVEPRFHPLFWRYLPSVGLFRPAPQS